MLKINQTLGLLAAILIAAVLLFGLYFVKREFYDESPTEILSAGPTVEELQQMSELVSTKVIISDILEGENDQYKGTWIIRGDALLTIDLSKATITKVDQSNRTATLTLPQPQVTSARVDHTASRTYDVVKKKWFTNKDNEARLRDTAMKQAQKLVESTAASDENFQAARQNAQSTLQAFYQKLDWQIDIVWQNSSRP